MLNDRYLCFNIKKKRCGMFANEKTIHQSFNEVDLGNFILIVPSSTVRKNPNCMVGYAKLNMLKYKTIQLKKTKK